MKAKEFKKLTLNDSEYGQWFRICGSKWTKKITTKQIIELNLRLTWSSLSGAAGQVQPSSMRTWGQLGPGSNVKLSGLEGDNKVR